MILHTRVLMELTCIAQDTRIYFLKAPHGIKVYIYSCIIIKLTVIITSSITRDRIMHNIPSWITHTRARIFFYMLKLSLVIGFCVWREMKVISGVWFIAFENAKERQWLQRLVKLLSIYEKSRRNYIKETTKIISYKVF